MIVLPCDPAALRAPIVFSALDASVARDVEAGFAQAGRLVLSNAKSFRMDDDVPLVIPEVNADHLALLDVQRRQRGWKGAIVTNANCSSIVAVMALAPLHRAFGITRMFVSTMQAVSGAGYLIAVPGEKTFTAVSLDDDIFYLREDLVFAFEATLRWENGNVPGLRGKLPVVQFRGDGAVALRTAEPLVRVKLPAQGVLLVAAMRLAGWIGRVIPRAVVPPTDGPMGEVCVECTGEGVVFIDPAATQVGLAILQRGGSAVDAAIAASFALGVVEPYMSGIGGGCFVLLHDGASGKITAIDARGVAPAATSSSQRSFASGPPSASSALCRPRECPRSWRRRTSASISRRFTRKSARWRFSRCSRRDSRSWPSRRDACPRWSSPTRTACWPRIRNTSPSVSNN
jgi:uncharacterized protein (AIM24 family)